VILLQQMTYEFNIFDLAILYFEMNDLNDLGASMEADIAKDNLKELISEKADSIAESLMGVTPGLSVVFKLSKIYHSVQDFFLMEKVVAFLTDVSSMEINQRENLISKLNNDPIHGQKFGKFLILAIDRLEYVDKALYLARICKFYEREDISQELLIRMKGIMEKIELTDLKKLRCTKNSDLFHYFGYPNRFDSEGLYLFQSLDLISFEHTASDFKEYQKLKIGRKAGNIPRPAPPRLTILGRILIHIINDIPFDKWLKQSSLKQNI
jgi:hypothetical protein